MSEGSDISLLNHKDLQTMKLDELDPKGRLMRDLAHEVLQLISDLLDKPEYQRTGKDGQPIVADVNVVLGTLLGAVTTVMLSEDLDIRAGRDVIYKILTEVADDEDRLKANKPLADIDTDNDDTTPTKHEIH